MTTTHPRTTAAARALLVMLLALTAVAGAFVSGAPASSAFTRGERWFEPDKPYYGEFADPDVYQENGVYYAYGTNTGGAYLPVMRSTDQKTWIARSAYDPGINPRTGVRYATTSGNWDPYYNDALPDVARWADRSGCTSVYQKWCVPAWAPTVEKLKNGKYLLAYATRQSNAKDRWCISVATSWSPQGPFKDETTAPVICSSDPKGSIDPDLFRDPRSGLLFMVWKNEGVPGSQPTKIWTWVVNENGSFRDTATTFQTQWKPWQIMQTAWPWEGNVVENPSMVYYKGKHYLFYSGNLWKTTSYATGEAMCDSANSYCGRASSDAVLRSVTGNWGPGGASGYVDRSGTLKLMYSAWNSSGTYWNSASERVYHIATMSQPDWKQRVFLVNRG